MSIFGLIVTIGIPTTFSILAAAIGNHIRNDWWDTIDIALSSIMSFLAGIAISVVIMTVAFVHAGTSQIIKVENDIIQLYDTTQTSEGMRPLTRETKYYYKDKTGVVQTFIDPIVVTDKNTKDTICNKQTIIRKGNILTGEYSETRYVLTIGTQE